MSLSLEVTIPPRQRYEQRLGELSSTELRSEFERLPANVKTAHLIAAIAAYRELTGGIEEALVDEWADCEGTGR